MCSSKTFSVYMHVSPLGKIYVGLTGKNPKDRWRGDGKGYVSNKHFWSAICVYGWDNFEHVVVASELSKSDACKLESCLIRVLGTTNPDLGYNRTFGGEHESPSEATRERLRETSKRMWENPEIRDSIVSKLTGTVFTEERKLHISASKRGKKINYPTHRRPMTKEEIEKRKGRIPWNIGLTKYTDDRIKKSSEKLTGLKRSEESRKRIAAAAAHRFESPVWINNGIVEHFFDTHGGSNPIPEGFELGRLDLGYTYIHKDSVTKRVRDADLQNFLMSGWSIGKSPEIQSNVAKSIIQYVWILDGLHEFTCAADLAEYLHSHGYPKIASGTITNLYNKGFSTSKIYYTLDGRISRRRYNHAS